MPRVLVPCVVALALLGATGCRSGDETPSAAAVSAPVPGVTLPAGELRDLVPTPAEVPPGMTPLLTATGPRDAAAIAGFSADPAAAGRALRAHGFTTAYVAQYAHPRTGEVLSVVVTRFGTVAGAIADMTQDVAASGGTPVPAATVGDTSTLTTQPLPDGGGELVTLRFRSGATTWLVAYGRSPKADPAVAVRLAQPLARRAVT